MQLQKDCKNHSHRSHFGHTNQVASKKTWIENAILSMLD